MKSGGILYVCAEHVASGSGPALHVEAVCRELARAGQAVLLVQQGEFRSKSFATVEVPPVRPGAFQGWRIRHAIEQSARFHLALHRPRAVYCRGSFPTLARAVRASGVPLIVEYNGVLGQELVTAGVPWIRRIWMLRREAAVAHLCDAAVAVDETTRIGMCRYYPVLKDKCVVVRNGCDVELFRHAGFAVQREWNTLVFVGGFHPWTRLDLSLRAFALLPDVTRFEIVGDGPRRPEFEALCQELGLSDRVRFHGRLPHHKIPGILGRCGIGLAIESGDAPGGQPLKLAEYLAAGCAVLTNAYAGLEFIETAQFGSLLPFPPTPESIAQAVQKLLARPTALATRTAARQDYAREHLSWERAAREILDVVNAQVAVRSRPVTA